MARDGHADAGRKAITALYLPSGQVVQAKQPHDAYHRHEVTRAAFLSQYGYRLRLIKGRAAADAFTSSRLEEIRRHAEQQCRAFQ